MTEMPASDAPRKPLLGLRIIEAWCWLWVAFWTAEALLLIFDLFGTYAAFALEATVPFLAMDPYAGALLLGAPLPLALFSVGVAIGFKARRIWVRGLISLAALGLVNAAIALYSTSSVPHMWLWDEQPPWAIFPAIQVPILGFCSWMIWYLTRPHVKEAFGVGKKEGAQ